MKQVALLLCDALSACGADGELSREAIRDQVNRLVAEHGDHWGRDASQPAQIASLAEAATEVLIACDLLRRLESGALRPSPLAGRFRAPSLRTAGVEP